MDGRQFKSYKCSSWPQFWAELKRLNFQKVSSKDIPDFMTPQEGITYSRDVLYYLPNKVNMNSAK